MSCLFNPDFVYYKIRPNVWVNPAPPARSKANFVLIQSLTCVRDGRDWTFQFASDCRREKMWNAKFGFNKEAMMRKIAFSIFCFSCVMSMATVGQAEEITVDSVIKQAVVYPSSARVTRVAKVSLKEGSQTIKFKGVQPGFDENSLSVSGKGTAVAKILGAGIKVTYLKESPDEKVRELESKIQALDDQAAGFQGETNTLLEKKTFLDSIRLFTGGQMPKDLVTKVPSAEELKATLSFVETEFKAFGDAALALEIKKRELAKEHEKLQNELNEVRSTFSKEERSLAVDIECEKAGDLEVELSYSVPQASWYPLYDARVDFEKGKAIVSAFAVTRQTAGEDWKDTQLTLSTSQPSIGGRMPELSSWYVRPMEPRKMRKKAMQYEPYYLSEATERMKKSDAVGGGSLSAPAAAPVQAAAVDYAPSISSGASLVYKVGRSVTIKSDGSDVRVPLMSQTLDAAFEYAATPKLSPYAYLRSKVTNGPKDQLLAGRVNIFLDGAFVGASDIPKTIATGEAFDLYLGVDEGVVVKRELLEEKTDDTLIGSIPSPTKKIAYKYKITVENYKPRAIKINLFDQVPVAQDDKIKVVKVESSVKPDTDKYKDHEGVYLWTLSLQAKEKKEIILSYVVEYPRDMNVDGL